MVFEVLAIYAWVAEACKLNGHDPGNAVSSPILGALVLLGLMYSGITWLFIGADMAGVQM